MTRTGAACPHLLMPSFLVSDVRGTLPPRPSAYPRPMAMAVGCVTPKSFRAVNTMWYVRLMRALNASRPPGMNPDADARGAGGDGAGLHATRGRDGGIVRRLGCRTIEGMFQVFLKGQSWGRRGTGTYWKRGGGGGGGLAGALFVRVHPLVPKARKKILPQTVEGEEGEGGGDLRGGGVGTRPRYSVVRLWRRLLTSRYCSL